MKNLKILAVILLFVLPLAACGGEDTTTGDTTGDTTTISGNIMLSGTVAAKPGKALHSAAATCVAALQGADVYLYDADRPEWIFPVASARTGLDCSYTLKELTNSDLNLDADGGKAYTDNNPIPAGNYTVIAMNNIVITGGEQYVAVQPYVKNFKGAVTGNDLVAYDSDTVPKVVSMLGLSANADGTYGGVGTSLMRNAAIQITFNMAMARLSVLQSVSIKTAMNADVSGRWKVSADLLSATFYPTDNLTVGTAYIMTVDTAAQNVYGTKLSSAVTGLFTAESEDTTPPNAIAYAPSTQIDVPVNTTIQIASNELLDMNTIEVTSTPSIGDKPSVIYAGKTGVGQYIYVYEIVPNDLLQLNTDYEIIVSGARDMAGLSLTALTFNFKTETAVTLPEVSSIGPADGATDVALDSALEAVFTSLMDPATINSSTFSLHDGVANVSGSVSYDPMTRTATFTPSEALVEDTSYTATITTGVTDLSGNAMASDKTWSFTSTASSNTATPVANAGPDQNVTTDSLVTLDGSGSSDADLDTLTYSWSFVSVPSGSTAALSDSTVVNPTFTADLDGSYVVSLVVNDGTVDSAADMVTIAAVTANSAPSANAGPDQSVTTNTLVTLDGSGSSDADLDTLTYSWSFVSVPSGSTAALSDSTVVNPTFTADLDGSYIVSLVVNDGTVDSAVDTETIAASTLLPLAGSWSGSNISFTVSSDSSSVSDFEVTYSDYMSGTYCSATVTITEHIYSSLTIDDNLFSYTSSDLTVTSTFVDSENAEIDISWSKYDSYCNAYYSGTESYTASCTGCSTTTDSGEGWTVGSPMPTARSWAASAVIGSDIYVIGGGGGFDKVEKYDTSTDSWTSLSNTTYSGFLSRGVALNGLIYIFGGSGSQSVYSYDPVVGNWTQLNDMPLLEWMGEPAVVNGKVYIFGGYDSVAVSAVNTVFEYDPALDTWTTKTPMPTARYGSATAVYNNKIYVLGGGYGSFTNEVYDPATDTWESKTSIPVLTNGWSIAGEINGKIYLINSGTFSVPGEMGIYSPLTNTWQSVDGLSVPRDFLTGEVVDGKLYVIGGTDSNLNKSSRVDIYTPLLLAAPKLTAPADSGNYLNDKPDYSDFYHKEHLETERAIRAFQENGQ